jgi:hypothetical protein
MPSPPVPDREGQFPGVHQWLESVAPVGERDEDGGRAAEFGTELVCDLGELPRIIRRDFREQDPIDWRRIGPVVADEQVDELSNIVSGAALDEVDLWFVGGSRPGQVATGGRRATTSGAGRRPGSTRLCLAACGASTLALGLAGPASTLTGADLCPRVDALRLRPSTGRVSRRLRAAAAELVPDEIQ